MPKSRIERMLKDVRITSYGKLAVLTIAAAVAAIFIAVTSLTSGELTASETAAPLQADSDFVYFPGQYVNKATGPSEYIQPF